MGNRTGLPVVIVHRTRGRLLRLLLLLPSSASPPPPDVVHTVSLAVAEKRTQRRITSAPRYGMQA